MEHLDAKERILAAALRIFADKGFDGARMDVIARTAGVNKGLIYYYFRSKKELLQHLFDGFFDECNLLFNKVVAALNFGDSGNFHEIFDDVFAYLERNESLVRVIMLETLKKDSSETFLFDLINLFMGKDLQSFVKMSRELGAAVEDNVDIDQVRVTEFFTMLGPLILYILLKDEWAEFFTLDRTRVEKYFVEALRMTHIKHHQNP